MNETKVVFNNCTGNKVLFFKENSTLSEIFSDYAEETKISLNDFMFLSNGELIKIDSTKKLKDITKDSGNETSILVIDKTDYDISNDEDKQIDTINKNQFLDRNLKSCENKIQKVIEDMSILGYLTKKKIDQTIENNAQYMTIDQAIEKQFSDSQMFILGILGKYLSNLGINTIINPSNAFDEKFQNLCNTVLQFVFNGLIFKKKYYFSFSLGDKRKEDLHKSREEQQKFSTNLKKALNQIYGFSEENIIVTRPIYHQYYTIIVVFNQENLSISKDYLMNTFMNYPELSKLIEVKKENIIEGIILNKCMLEPRGNSKDGQWGYYEKRGGEDYYPPDGFDRYGLNVYKKYDNCNDDWLSYDGRPGEWCIAYSWLTNDKNANNLSDQYENDDDSRNEGKKVGKGIYCSQLPDKMEEYSQAIDIKGNKFQLGLMLRVNPIKIRAPKSTEDFWVVNGDSDEIRPYGILIKKIN